MIKKVVITLLTGAILVTATLPLTVQAGRGGGGGGGPMGGTSLRTKTRIQDRDQLRLRDGSCTNSTANQAGSGFKKGNTYGPGDGTGNAGVGPKNGTGYGAPSNR
ncbi:MAG: hypothetical protein A2Y79_02375 [Deltaproteobacteria bacterium RBG_13_43_22]|nr:MAG: hypothetical protein A2Y79_02375 [Deltaproteobacteria bacterium RBG_13_43_22]